jgi:hypothetical protein
MTKIYAGQRALLISKLGPPNPLLVSQWQQPIKPQQATPVDKLSAEEYELKRKNIKSVKF